MGEVLGVMIEEKGGGGIKTEDSGAGTTATDTK